MGVGEEESGLGGFRARAHAPGIVSVTRVGHRAPPGGGPRCPDVLIVRWLDYAQSSSRRDSWDIEGRPKFAHSASRTRSHVGRKIEEAVNAAVEALERDGARAG